MDLDMVMQEGRKIMAETFGRHGIATSAPLIVTAHPSHLTSSVTG